MGVASNLSLKQKFQQNNGKKLEHKMFEQSKKTHWDSDKNGKVELESKALNTPEISRRVAANKNGRKLAGRQKHSAETMKCIVKCMPSCGLKNISILYLSAKTVYICLLANTKMLKMQLIVNDLECLFGKNKY